MMSVQLLIIFETKHTKMPCTTLRIKSSNQRNETKKIKKIISKIEKKKD